MISAGIKEVKNNLSRLLARVKAGEEILVTERGNPVARIVKADATHKSIHAALGPLVERGLIALPSRGLRKDRLSAVEATGRPISEMVIEDRR